MEPKQIMLSTVGGLVDFATLGVTTDVDWKSYFSCKFATLFQNGINGVYIYISMLWKLLEVFSHVKHFVHHKLHIAQGWVIGWHIDGSLVRWVKKTLTSAWRVEGAIAGENIVETFVRPLNGARGFQKAGFIVQRKNEPMNFKSHLLLI